MPHTSVLRVGLLILVVAVYLISGCILNLRIMIKKFFGRMKTLWNILQNEMFSPSPFQLSLLCTIQGDKMFGHPRLYFGEFERLSEHIEEPQHLISAVASIHRLTPQHATELYHEWSKHTHRQPLTAAGK
jgi:hypothetical protein